MYLDDGLGGADTFEKCKDVSLVVKMISLILLLLFPRKSLNWNPVQESIWLGLIWYTVDMILMLCDRQYLISSLRTFEKIKPAVAKPKHKTLNT
jgi:hypothetical protein